MLTATPDLETLSDLPVQISHSSGRRFGVSKTPTSPRVSERAACLFHSSWGGAWRSAHASFMAIWSFVVFQEGFLDAGFILFPFDFLLSSARRPAVNFASRVRCLRRMHRHRFPAPLARTAVEEKNGSHPCQCFDPGGVEKSGPARLGVGAVRESPLRSITRFRRLHLRHLTFFHWRGTRQRSFL